jgi:dCMP deaminase
MGNFTNWDEYFLAIAYVVAKKSHCLSIQRGVVIVNAKQILCTGYNGPPPSFPHCDDAFRRGKLFNQYGLDASKYNELDDLTVCPRRKLGFKSGEGLEFCAATHAELNAILQSARHGVSVVGGTLYLTGKQIPCRECAKAIVGAGLKRVVMDGQIETYPQVGVTGAEILETCKIEVVGYER